MPSEDLIWHKYVNDALLVTWDHYNERNDQTINQITDEYLS